MSLTTEQLDAIIEAGKRMKDAGRLSNEYWRARDVYEPLAINHADALAAEAKRLSGLVERLRGQVAQTHFLCERCGGYGQQKAGCFSTESGKYDSLAGECQLCDGTGYLGPRK